MKYSFSLLTIALLLSGCVTTIPLSISPQEEVTLKAVYLTVEDIYPKRENNDLFSTMGKIANGIALAKDLYEGKIPENILVQERILSATHENIKSRFPINLLPMEKPETSVTLNDYFFPVRTMVKDEFPPNTPYDLTVSYDVRFNKNGIVLFPDLVFSQHWIEATPIITIHLEARDKKGVLMWYQTTRYTAPKPIKIDSTFILGAPVKDGGKDLESLVDHINRAWELARTAG